MSLYPIKCRCGKSTMNFAKPLGEFYIDTCCQIAGYDHLGNMKKEAEEVVPGADMTVADVTAEVKSPAEKKKRAYNRGGNVKTDEQP